MVPSTEVPTLSDRAYRISLEVWILLDLDWSTGWELGNSQFPPAAWMWSQGGNQCPDTAAGWGGSKTQAPFSPSDMPQTPHYPPDSFEAKEEKDQSLTLGTEGSFWGYTVHLLIAFIEAILLFYKILILRLAPEKALSTFLIRSSNEYSLSTYYGPQVLVLMRLFFY